MTEGGSPKVVSRWRVGLRQAMLGGIVMAMALGVGVCIPLAPLWFDDYKLDSVVRAVALDARDFGQDKGWERLRYELAAQKLERRLAEEQCSVVVDDGVVVDCSWEAVILVPLVDRLIPLRFRSVASVGSNGQLK